MAGKKIIKDSSALGQFGSAIAQICEEKGIDKEKVVESVEAALAAAYKKDYGKKGQIIVAKLDEKNGEVDFKQLREVVDENVCSIEEEFLNEEVHEIPKSAVKSEEAVDRTKNQDSEDPAVMPRFNPERDILIEDAKKIDKTIEVGDFLEIPLETKDQYGRVASQTAKQVIIQRIREAERDSMHDEYKRREGEVVNGTVQRIELNKVFVDLGKAVGVLFPSEQIPTEQYRVGQRLRVYIDKVESDPKGPGITLSRRHPNLLLKLFELEVPEIFAGTVEIGAIAREAGARSKIAVLSNEEGIDPIGSCVGQKGTRVQAVIDEVNGEKIDIIEWNDDVEKLIASALSPAKVINVEIKEEEKEASVFVVKDQLSLAIGKKGQNVRLAAKLTGWKIDVETIDDEEGDDEDVVDRREQVEGKEEKVEVTVEKEEKETKKKDGKDGDKKEEKPRKKPKKKATKKEKEKVVEEVEEEE
ncbi:MAG: transcription termination factor NusA [Patescibacteria group bacterium]|nr:transcription termination factor NusA [Patescibacteria group bacterium]